MDIKQLCSTSKTFNFDEHPLLHSSLALMVLLSVVVALPDERARYSSSCTPSSCWAGSPRCTGSMTCGTTNLPRLAQMTPSLVIQFGFRTWCRT